MSRCAQLEDALERAKARVAYHERRAADFAAEGKQRLHINELLELARAEANLAWFEAQLWNFVAGMDT
jgi:hypothetical protein